MINNSFIEMSARERAVAILDKDSYFELLNPYESFKSPHLLNQEIVAQNDDGVVVIKGRFDGNNAVVISIEGDFQGGGIGEVSGAKIAGTLELILEDLKKGILVQPIIILDTGGVRLQEANYGLLAISEMQSAIVEIRDYVPVIGVIPGRIGCFGGMSMTAGLFSYLIMTKEGRLTLNGPEVIEQEAGIEEFNSSDKNLVWKTTGGEYRVKAGLADYLVIDDLEEVIMTIKNAIKLGVPKQHRSKDNLKLKEIIEHNKNNKEISNAHIVSRGSIWHKGIVEEKHLNISEINSILCSDIFIDNKKARVISVVTDKNSSYPRASKGEIGLEQGLEISRLIWEAINEDEQGEKRPIIAIVDSPSQAYGYKEELLGIFLTCSTAVNAYVQARLSGHPVISLIVGNAISGAFLAHGLQGSYMIALNDEKIVVNAMSKESASRITKRSISDMEDSFALVPGIAYDIKSFNKLGTVNKLIELSDHDNPTREDIKRIEKEIQEGIEYSLIHDNTLKYRFENANAKENRKMSLEVRKRLKELW